MTKTKTRFKLNKSDIEFLKENDYIRSNDDLKQIQHGINIGKYTLLNTGVETEIDIKQVIDLIGRENFLTGAGRAAFHYTACRTVEQINGQLLDSEIAVYFDFNKIFEN